MFMLRRSDKLFIFAFLVLVLATGVSKAAGTVPPGVDAMEATFNISTFSRREFCPWDFWGGSIKGFRRLVGDAKASASFFFSLFPQQELSFKLGNAFSHVREISHGFYMNHDYSFVNP